MRAQVALVLAVSVGLSCTVIFLSLFNFVYIFFSFLGDFCHLRTPVVCEFVCVCVCVCRRIVCVRVCVRARKMHKCSCALCTFPLRDVISFLIICF